MIGQIVTVDAGGTVGVYLADVPSGTWLARIVNGEQTAVLNNIAVTLNGLSDTLSQAHDAGVTELHVTGASAWLSGYDYELGSVGGTTPIETVRMLSYSAGVVRLARPTLYAHPSATPIRSTLITCSPGAIASGTFRGGHLYFRESLTGLERAVVRLDCMPPGVQSPSRRFPHAILTEQDVFDRDARFDFSIIGEQDLRAWLQGCQRDAADALTASLPLLSLTRALDADVLVDAAALWALAKQHELLNPTATANRWMLAFERAIREVRHTAFVVPTRDP